MRSLFMVGLLFIVSSANAALVEVSWTGTVSRSIVAGTIDVGDTITGSYTYDDAAASIDGTHATNHVSSFSVNGLSGSTTNNQIWILDNNASVGDQFDSRGFWGDYSGDLIGGHTVEQIFVRFNDATQTAITGTSLPVSLNSADFDFGYTSRLDMSDGYYVHFHVTDFTMTTVPIPAAAWLFGSALAGLGWMRRKQAV